MQHLTLIDVMEAMGKLRVVFKEPNGTDAQALAHIWLEVLQGVEHQHFTWAIDEWIKTEGKFWPKPAGIRELALTRSNSERGVDGSLKGKYQRWAASSGVGDGEPCPVCEAVIGALPSGREGVQHDHQRHMEANVGYFGPRGVETGPHEGVSRDA